MIKLIVIANPNPESFSFKILELLESSLREAKKQYDVLDLYRLKPQQKFYTHRENKSIDIIQNKITKAHEIIFIHPIYWCGPPAILKNFLDVNFRKGFAYRYKDDVYEPLLTNKSMRLIVTSNESEEIYKEIGNPFLVAWKEFALGTGIELKGMIHIGNMRNNKGNRREILNKLKSKFESF